MRCDFRITNADTQAFRIANPKRQGFTAFGSELKVANPNGHTIRFANNRILLGVSPCVAVCCNRMA